MGPPVSKTPTGSPQAFQQALQPQRRPIQDQCPPPWRVEIDYRLDRVIVANPETGAVIYIPRTAIEGDLSAGAAIRKAIDRHEREREEATKPWDGSRKLDL